MANKMAGLARKWGMPATFSSAGLTSSMREERKGPNFDHLNVVSLTLHGQQTVQEVVSKATALFRYLHGVSLIADEKIRIEEQNNKKRIQETLNSLKELFSRLRALYDGSNRRIDEPSDQDLEAMIPLTSSQVDPDMEESNKVSALQIEYDTLREKLWSKNQQIKEVIDKLRALMWDVNTMMALKPS